MSNLNNLINSADSLLAIEERLRNVVTREDVLLSLTRLMFSILNTPFIEENKLIQLAETLDHLEETVC